MELVRLARAEPLVAELAAHVATLLAEMLPVTGTAAKVHEPGVPAISVTIGGTGQPVHRVPGPAGTRVEVHGVAEALGEDVVHRIADHAVRLLRERSSAEAAERSRLGGPDGHRAPEPPEAGSRPEPRSVARRLALLPGVVAATVRVGGATPSTASAGAVTDDAVSVRLSEDLGEPWDIELWVVPGVPCPQDAWRRTLR